MTDAHPEHDSIEDNHTFDSNTGRKSSLYLYQWSSLTDTIQFVESGSSHHTHSSLTSKQESCSSSISTAVDSEGYTEDEFESLTVDESTSVLSSTDSTTSNTDSSVERARDDFLKQKLNILTRNKIKSLSTDCIPQPCSVEQDHQSQNYHRQKIKLLHKKKNIQENDNDVTGKPPKSLQMDSKSCPKTLKNTRKIERLKIENLLFKIEKETAFPVHKPSKCKECRQLQSKLSEENYIKKKTAQLRIEQFYKDLEKHLYQKDSVTLIANIINAGPNPSDPPQEIWDRLLRRGTFS